MFESIFDKLASDISNSPKLGDEYIRCWQDFLSDVWQRIPDSILKKTAQDCDLSPHLLRESLRTSFEGLINGLPENSDKVPSPVRVKRRAGETRTEQHPSFARTAIVSSGNIPLVALAPAVMLASAQIPVIVKLSRADAALFPWLLHEIERRNKRLHAGIYAHHWPSDAPELQELFKFADKIFVFGSNQTVGFFQQNYPEKTVGFGHKFSVGYCETASADNIFMEGFARDAALYFQRGCLSLQALFVKTPADNLANWVDAFAQVYGQTVQKLHGGEGDVKPSKRLRQIQEILDLQGIEYRRIVPNFGLAIQTDRFAPELLHGEGALQIIPVKNVDEIFAQLKPFREMLQGLAIGCADKSRFETLQLLAAEGGFSYVCESGELQSPPLDWANGGVTLPDDLFDEN